MKTYHIDQTNEVWSRIVRAQAQKYDCKVKLRENGSYEFSEQDKDCENHIVSEVKKMLKGE